MIEIDKKVRSWYNKDRCLVCRMIYPQLARRYKEKDLLIFDKLISFEESEYYQLARSLFDFIKHLGLDQEFINYKKLQN